ncbi:efflux RND transporter periplasmic adaptor subunit [Rubellimicrobium sp. CFH 75288]|nr:efflux RND transporter periplasmic adaptor subunit [Rubellimicrobium sp. CFH 75288]
MLLLILGLSAAAQEPGPAVDLTLPSVTVSEVTVQTLRDRVIASGLVAPVEEVQVSPLVEGQPIDALLADVGDRVEEGDVLARLSTATLELQLSQLAANRASVRAQIAQAEASLVQAVANAEEAERVAERTARLAQEGTVPRAQADQAQAAAIAARAAVGVAEQGVEAARAQMELVEAQIANAELQLARTEVRAPVSGLVVGRNAQVGAVASAAAGPLFTLVRDGELELRAELAEGDLLRVSPGQRATMTAVGSTAPIEGVVRLVEPTINPQTRMGVARIALDDDARVVQGMFLTAEILLREERQLAVPVTAIGTGAEGTSVMRIRDGVAEQVAVRTGIRDGSLIGVVEGLSPGDLVVTKAGAFVRAGDRVNSIPDADQRVAARSAADGEDTP